MQSNTVVVENQPINFPNFSVEKRTSKPDPFTLQNRFASIPYPLFLSSPQLRRQGLFSDSEYIVS